MKEVIFECGCRQSGELIANHCPVHEANPIKTSRGFDDLIEPTEKKKGNCNGNSIKILERS